MRLGLISNKWELREPGRFSLAKRCNRKMNTNDTLGRCWVNDNHQTPALTCEAMTAQFNAGAEVIFLSRGGWMTALITHKPVFAYPVVNWVSIRKQWGRENQSEVEIEGDEEVDHILHGVQHANDFSGNSSIICRGLIIIHNLMHKAAQTHGTLSSEETSEESDYRPIHLASACLRPLHNYKQPHLNTGLIVILHFGLTNNLH